MFDFVRDERFNAVEEKVRKAYGLGDKPDDDAFGPRVAFLRHKAACWVTCTPRDVWFSGPSMVALWDSTAPLPVVHSEKEWHEVEPAIFVAYHLGRGSTFAATTIYGMPERVFIWLDEEENLPDMDYIVRMLETYRKEHPDHGWGS